MYSVIGNWAGSFDYQPITFVAALRQAQGERGIESGRTMNGRPFDRLRANDRSGIGKYLYIVLDSSRAGPRIW